MTFANKIRITLVAAAALLVAWQFQQHQRQNRQLVAVETQLQTQNQEVESQSAALAELQHRSGELEVVERRAGNQALISLMRERAAAATSQADSEARTVGNTLARVLDNPEQQQVDHEFIRNKMRADMGLFFKLIHLPPEQIEQYVAVAIENEQRKANRTAALLRGTMTVADALRERDGEKAESESRSRGILGTNGAAFLDSIADGMRNDEAKRQVGAIQQIMGDAPMTQAQSDRLQSLIKTEIVMMPLDDSDTDLFRSPDEWGQIAAERYDKVLTEAAAFLGPAQLDILKAVAAADLAQRKGQMLQKRKTLGIK